MTSPLARELVYVTGKGGTGKTTVALCVAMAAARRGRRAIVCELAGQRRAASLHGRPHPPAGEEVELAPGLWATTIDPQRALEEWAARQVGSRRPRARDDRLGTASARSSPPRPARGSC